MQIKTIKVPMFTLSISNTFFRENVNSVKVSYLTIAVKT